MEVPTPNNKYKELQDLMSTYRTSYIDNNANSRPLSWLADSFSAGLTAIAA